MDLVGIFLSVFAAELGDKTQLATVMLAAAGRHSPLVVFALAASALVVSTAGAVFVGSLVGKLVDAWPLDLIAGIGFIAVGSWLIAQYFLG